jgi:hypothetical protein
MYLRHGVWWSAEFEKGRLSITKVLLSIAGNPDTVMCGSLPNSNIEILAAKDTITKYHRLVELDVPYIVHTITHSLLIYTAS